MAPGTEWRRPGCGRGKLTMGIISAISAGLQAAAAFFGWKKQVETNKPAEEKRAEIQTDRKDRDETDAQISDWASRP